ncbi:MAG: Ig-like domain-containing protein [candidate division KSB1 bacterium]|nr:Ig-like domain-containing protein [candidate division KSB1 bacterium]
MLLIMACAHQVPPSGGPEDKTPPEVVATYPEPGAVRVPRDAAVEFVFSEKIDRDTFPGALFVSPNPAEPLRFKFRGRTARIQFPDSLLPQRTYVITLGTDLKDNHGNSMAQSFTLAFSTGDSIDHGEIAGRVVDKKPQGVAIWAYILPDSGDPAFDAFLHRAGDYITQAGDDGQYRFSYLSHGRYRLVAVRDEARDGVYNPGEDAIGVTFGDVVISARRKRYRHLHFRLQRADTVRPALSQASMLNQRIIEIRFDEPVVAADTSDWSRYFVVRTEAGDTLPIRAVARFPLDPRVFYAVLDPVTQPGDLRLDVMNLFDASGNPVDTAYAYDRFGAKPVPDTLAPRIIRIVPADSALNVPLDEPVRIVFNEWMQPADSASGIAVTDSSGQAVEGSIVWESPFSMSFRPSPQWASKMRYTITLDTSQFRDLAGNALLDTTGVRTFVSIDRDTLSSIAGRIHFEPAELDSVPVFLRLQQAGGKLYYSLWLPHAGPYEFQNILPGVYTIEGYLDENRNHRFDPGQPLPFRPSEHFFQVADSIKVRSRWPNVGNDLLIKWQ